MDHPDHVLPDPHPDVAPDFLFGNITANPETLRELVRARGLVQHQQQISPLRPQSGAPVLVTATSGPAHPTAACWLYYTTDSSRPAGHSGHAHNGTAVHMVAHETVWEELLWDYLTVWRATIPPQPAGTWVRYQIEALPVPGGDLAPRYADADPQAAGGLQPVFSYLVEAPLAPAWAHEAIFYHIFLDRFNPGAGRTWQGDAATRAKLGGTLRGVTEQLDYIAALGVNTLWLSPLFASPTYHRYDASDLFQVDPPLGTNADLGELVREAHTRGLRVILDMVPNHISNRHPRFEDAQRNPDSPYRDWFTFTNWPNDYRMFYTSRGMPRLNNEHGPARAWLFEAVRYWMDEYGVDGYRLDYVLGPSYDFWTDYYRTVKRTHPDSFSVGEAWHGAEVMRSFEGRMDGVLDFNFLNMIRGLVAFDTLAVSAFDQFLVQNRAYYTPGYLTPTFLDNHDMNRFLWMARGEVRRLRAAVAIQFTLAPPPIIYYGTEVGIRQTGDTRTHGDLVARSPMLWGPEQDTDLLAYYQRLLAVRRAHPAIWQGTRHTVHLDDATRVYVYANVAPGQPGLLTMLNLGPDAHTLQVALPDGVPLPADPRDVLNDHRVTVVADGLRVTLPPLGVALVPLPPAD